MPSAGYDRYVYEINGTFIAMPRNSVRNTSDRNLSDSVARYPKWGQHRSKGKVE